MTNFETFIFEDYLEPPAAFLAKVERLALDVFVLFLLISGSVRFDEDSFFLFLELFLTTDAAIEFIGEKSLILVYDPVRLLI